jgi:hypothetical protein
VTRVQDGSVADRRDEANRLLPGDVIVSVWWPGNRYRVTSREEFEQIMQFLAQRRPQSVEFIVVTKEGPFRVTLELREERS